MRNETPECDPLFELDVLEQYTRSALAAGVFAAQIFWGQDRLELLERALKKLG